MMRKPAYPVLIPCEGEELVGIVHQGAADQQRAVVVIVAGGPQYRVGAHRQFLSLAKVLATEGYTVLRFDLRGMGDSSGGYLGFENSHADISCAIDHLVENEPQVREIVLFGECESASGALFYGYSDRRVKGLILINPWVRTPEGRAKVIIRHYYVQRLFSGSFWRKVLGGQYRPLDSLQSFGLMLGRVLRGWYGSARARNAAEADDTYGLPLPVRTAAGFKRFDGRKLIVVSGNDYIAREFDVIVKSSASWKGLMDSENVQRLDVPEADHSFSEPSAKARVQQAVLRWMQSW